MSHFSIFFTSSIKIFQTGKISNLPKLCCSLGPDYIAFDQLFIRYRFLQPAQTLLFFSSIQFMMNALEAHRVRYQRPVSTITGLAHLFGFIAIVLLLVWLLHFRGGIDLNSDNPFRVFNVHPFLMFFGLIFMAGEAMMAYKTVVAERKVQKSVHMFLHLVAVVLGIVGIHAAFKFHEQRRINNLYSLHSWIGIGTFSLFCLQWLVGLTVFLVPGAPQELRARAAPWHVNGGKALLFMAITAALTGLMQRATLLQLQQQTEARVVNFLGLAILLFGIFVDLSVSLGRYYV